MNDTFTCSWCNKPIPAEDGIITKRESAICKKCLLHNFPDVYQLVFGDRALNQNNHDKPLWKLRGCPHCGGDMFLDWDNRYICLLCGRQPRSRTDKWLELQSSAKRGGYGRRY